MSEKMNYPLIKRCFPGLTLVSRGIINHYISAKELERELEQAKSVYGSTCFNSWEFDTQPHKLDTHSAIILGIEPIKKETAEDVLRELIEKVDLKYAYDIANLTDVIKRARKVLGEK